MRRRSAVAAAVAVAFAAAACTGGGDERADRPAATTATTAAGSSTTATTAPATSTTAATSTTLDPSGCAAVPASAEPDPARPLYQVDATVDVAGGTVDGTLSVRFTPDLPTDRLVFRLWPNGPRPAAAGVRLVVGPVTPAGGGAPLPASSPDPTTHVVTLPEPVAAGRTVEVSLPWHLDVPGPVADRTSRSGDSMRLGSFLPLLAWEPGLGWATEPPTGGYAEASTFPVADFDLTVDVPPGYLVLGPGRAGFERTWRAEAVRDVALAVARFTLTTLTVAAPDPVEVTVGVAPGVPDDGQAYADAAASALEDFATRFGPYPWPSLAIAVTADLPGGIEYPSVIHHGPGTVDHVAHEVAHQWFYGLVGNNQGRDPWLDEGLATWAQTRVDTPPVENLPRPVPEAAVGQAGQPMAWWEDHLDSYYRGVYVQPALALHALGDDERVDCALRRYVAGRSFGIARPRDLFDELTAEFPDAAAVLAPYGLSP